MSFMVFEFSVVCIVRFVFVEKFIMFSCFGFMCYFLVCDRMRV